MLDAILWKLLEGVIGVGLEPLFPTETGLEGSHALRLFQPQLFPHQTGGLVAQAVIRISVVEIALGRAVVGEQKFLRHAVLVDMVLHALGQGADVQRIVHVAADEADRGDPAPGFQLIGQGVEGGGRGGSGVLGIQRQHHDAPDTQLLKFPHYLGYGWVAIAHGEFDDHLIPKGFLHGTALVLADHQQW